MAGTIQPVFLGIDLGGTNIKVGLVDDHGSTLAYKNVQTEASKGPEVGLGNMFRAISQLFEKSDYSLQDSTYVGLATPGTMDIPAGILLDPPNLPSWDNFPIRDRVAAELRKPTILQNDANAAAYGEYWVGAGRDAHSIAFWTLGTGIGGGIVINDMIIQGRHSHGSECGHIIIEMDNGRLCPSGQYGTLEAYSSATALIKACEDGLAGGVETSIRQRVAAGEEVTPILMGEEASAGDQFAEDLIMEAARCLGVATTSVMHTVDPDMVLLGGAMTFGRNETELGRRFINRVREEVKLRAFPVPYERTIIEYAALGSNAGYTGAAGCARRAFIREQS